MRRRLAIVALVLAVPCFGLAAYAWYFAHFLWASDLVLYCDKALRQCHGDSPPQWWPWLVAPGCLAALGFWGVRRARDDAGAEQGLTAEW